MESNRQKKFASLLQEELAAIFQREGMNYLPNTLVTITKVRVSPDLAVAKIYLSLMPATNAAVAIKGINAHASEIRYKLGARIRHQVRIIPSLNFFEDDTSAYVERMDQLFDEIERERKKYPSNDEE